MPKIKEIRIVRCKHCLHKVELADIGEEQYGTMYDDAVKCSLFQCYRAGRGFCSCGSAGDPDDTLRCVEIKDVIHAIEVKRNELQELVRWPQGTVDVGLKPYRQAKISTYNEIIKMLQEVGR